MIDCFAYILLKEQEALKKNSNKPAHKTVFVNSLCWTILTKWGEEAKEKQLYKIIEDACKNDVRYVQFPMNSTGRNKNAEPFHWTLLVYDMHEGIWKHYNSNRPKKGSTDYHLQDAKTMKEYIEEKSRKEYELGLQRNDESNSDYNISQSQRARLLHTQDFKCPLISMDNCPQQPAGSVDCGIVMMYIMHRLSLDLPYDSVLSQEKVRAIRAKIATSLMKHQ